MICDFATTKTSVELVGEYPYLGFGGKNNEVVS